jgi:hypothetical protein
MSGKGNRPMTDDPAVTTAPTEPTNDRRPAGENLWITRQRAVRGAGAVNGLASTRTPSGHIDAADAGTSDGVIDNFSSAAQGTLCSTKIFGIIKLLKRRPRLSTAAAPLLMNDMTVILSVTGSGAGWNISGQRMSSLEVDSCHRTDPVRVRVRSARGPTGLAFLPISWARAARHSASGSIAGKISSPSARLCGSRIANSRFPIPEWTGPRKSRSGIRHLASGIGNRVAAMPRWGTSE